MTDRQTLHCVDLYHVRWGIKSCTETHHKDFSGLLNNICSALAKLGKTGRHIRRDKHETRKNNADCAGHTKKTRVADAQRHSSRPVVSLVCPGPNLHK